MLPIDGRRRVESGPSGGYFLRQSTDGTASLSSRDSAISLETGGGGKSTAPKSPSTQNQLHKQRWPEGGEFLTLDFSPNRESVHRYEFL